VVWRLFGIHAPLPAYRTKQNTTGRSCFIWTVKGANARIAPLGSGNGGGLLERLRKKRFDAPVYSQMIEGHFQTTIHEGIIEYSDRSITVPLNSK
jgi:hypothetical protein